LRFNEKMVFEFKNTEGGNRHSRPLTSQVYGSEETAVVRSGCMEFSTLKLLKFTYNILHKV
jgi:hypothetical protein